MSSCLDFALLQFVWFGVALCCLVFHRVALLCMRGASLCDALLCVHLIGLAVFRFVLRCCTLPSFVFGLLTLCCSGIICCLFAALSFVLTRVHLLCVALFSCCCCLWVLGVVLPHLGSWEIGGFGNAKHPKFFVSIPSWDLEFGSGSCLFWDAECEMRNANLQYGTCGLAMQSDCGWMICLDSHETKPGRHQASSLGELGPPKTK